MDTIRFRCCRTVIAAAAAAVSVSVACAQDIDPNQAQIQKNTPGNDEGANIPAPLPKSLRGRWNNTGTGHSDIVVIEVLEMSTPRDGKALVTFWPYCNKSETPVVFERKRKVWRFTATNCSGSSEQIHMRVRPVEGKSRLEGWYHREGDGKTVYLEWQE